MSSTRCGKCGYTYPDDAYKDKKPLTCPKCGSKNIAMTLKDDYQVSDRLGSPKKSEGK